MHDEDKEFASRPTRRARPARAGPGFDGYSFTIAFKGVLLEGLEVAFIVITFGASQQRIGLAAVAAAVAVVGRDGRRRRSSAPRSRACPRTP